MEHSQPQEAYQPAKIKVEAKSDDQLPEIDGVTLNRIANLGTDEINDDVLAPYGLKLNSGVQAIMVDGERRYFDTSVEDFGTHIRANQVEEVAATPEAGEGIARAEVQQNLGEDAMEASGVESPTHRLESRLGEQSDSHAVIEASPEQVESEPTPVETAIGEEAIHATGLEQPSRELEERLGTVARAVETQQTAIETEKPVEKLGLNNYEIDLIGRLVHETHLQVYQEADSLSFNQFVMANYQGVMNGIEHGDGEKKTAQVLATLVAAGAIEELAMSHRLADTACQEIAKLVNPQEAGNLAYQLRQAVAYKERDDIAPEELSQEMYRRFMMMSQDSYLDDKPKLRAAILAFGSGMTVRQPQLSQQFMANLASFYQYDSQSK